MNQKIQISIPEPCHKGWKNMTPVERGRFCASCHKTVLDFTYLSDNEIINLVNENDDLCVRLKETQIDRNLIETKRTSNYFGYFATSVLAFLGLGIENIAAQEKPVTEQTDLKYHNKVTDSIKRIIVTGVVRDVDRNPMYGVVIIIKDAKTGVQTDEKGAYSIKSKSRDVLEFSYLGYEEKEIIVNSNKINVELIESDNIIGQMVIYKKTLSSVEHSVKLVIGLDS